MLTRCPVQFANGVGVFTLGVLAGAGIAAWMIPPV
jgi:hypothetical protein